MRAIRVGFPAKSRLAAALQLGFVRMTGTTMKALGYVPRGVLDRLGDQLDVPAPELATLRALYGRRQTLFDHQYWACQHGGFRRDPRAAEALIVQGLSGGRVTTLDRVRLVRHAREHLYDNGYLIPRQRTIEDWVRKGVVALENEDRTLIERSIAAPVREAWVHKLLVPDSPGGISNLEWLRRPPRRRSMKTLRQEVAKLRFLIDLLPPSDTTGIPLERLRAYGQRMRRRRPFRVRELKEPRRTLELAAHLAVLTTEQCDTVLRLVEMRIAAIWRWAHSLTPPVVAHVLPEAEACELAAAVDDGDLSDSDFRDLARTVLGPWRRSGPRSGMTRAAYVRNKLAQDSRRTRPLLKLVIALRLQGAPGDPVVMALGNLECSYEQGDTELFNCAEAPVGRAWNELVGDADRQRAFRAYEAATLWAVRRSLRNGSLWLAHAQHYGGRHRLLLPEDRWATVAPAFCARRGLPEQSDDFVEKVIAQLDTGLCSLDEAIRAGDVSIADGNRVQFKDDPTQPATPRDVNAIRLELYRKIGTVQLPEVLIDIDAQTHFSWILLGRTPKSPEDLVPVYAAVTAAATGLDATGISLMMPEVKLPAVRDALARLQEEQLLRHANDVVTSLLLAQPFSKKWGEGFEASSDLMSLDVSKHLWMARVDPKRRRHGVGSYTHVLDRWGIIYDQPLLLATRQAGAAIEGAIRQSTTRLERLAVDTHGYTDFAIAIAKLLGFDLCPRLSSLRDRHLHVPRGFTVPPSVEPLLRRDVSANAIKHGWDGLLQVAATIEDGWRTATEVLERFGSASRTDPVFRAGHALGQLLRTIYLCDYFTLPDFRRRIFRVLERGESVHALQRQICNVPLTPRRGRRRDELVVISGALTLVTNCVMAWNTCRLDSAFRSGALQSFNGDPSEALSHVGPVAHSHINFRGTYHFPVATHASRLTRAAA